MVARDVIDGQISKDTYICGVKEACEKGCLEIGFDYGLRVSYMKKPLTMTARGVSFGAGEMNRTPDLLITKKRIQQFHIVESR